MTTRRNLSSRNRERMLAPVRRVASSLSVRAQSRSGKRFQAQTKGSNGDEPNSWRTAFLCRPPMTCPSFFPATPRLTLRLAPHGSFMAVTPAVHIFGDTSRPGNAIANGGKVASSRGTAMPTEPRLGDYFFNRQEPGRDGLPVMSVTMNDSLVRRDELERRTVCASAGSAPTRPQRRHRLQHDAHVAGGLWSRGGRRHRVPPDSGAKRNGVKRSGFAHPFRARQAELGEAS